MFKQAAQSIRYLERKLPTAYQSMSLLAGNDAFSEIRTCKCNKRSINELRGKTAKTVGYTGLKIWLTCFLRPKASCVYLLCSQQRSAQICTRLPIVASDRQHQPGMTLFGDSISTISFRGTAYISVSLCKLSY